MTDVTVTNETPLANSAEARSQDGTLTDKSPASTTTPSSNEPKTEGSSFLTTEGKTDAKAEEPKSDKVEDKTKEAPQGAPEKYTDFKLPDGYAFDKDSLAAATALFKENNLSQEQAQKLVDFYAANSLQAAEAPYKEWASLQKQWTDEIGSRFPGEKSTQVRTMINGVINSVLPPTLAKGFRAALDLTGAGSHPDVVEALSIMMKPLSEGTPVRGNGPTKTGQEPPGAPAPSIAEAIYGHLRK